MTGLLLSELERTVNHARFAPGQREGHYESFFQRANHPSRPLAFWIRYTLVTRDQGPSLDGAAMAELWAIVFDGETGEHVSVKTELPIERARLDRSSFDVRVGEATLGPATLRGESTSGGHRVAWDLRYRPDGEPLVFYPPALYASRLPRAKLLVGAPIATYDGAVVVDGRELPIDGWIGSQNHNWGSRHTDHYAWGQVAGFDTREPREPREPLEHASLEIATARLRLGGVWTPFMTPAVLRLRGREHRASSPLALLRGRGRFQAPTATSGASWSFAFTAPEVTVTGSIEARREDFVELAYLNPPGGTKTCLNSKIATCRLEVTHTAGPEKGRVETLVAERRAAFEILSDPG